MIGTGETAELARAWLDETSDGVRGNEKHPEFPGFKRDRGFFSQLVFDDRWVEQFGRAELASVLKVRRSRDRFTGAVDLIDQKLRLLAQRDYRPEYVVIAMPKELRSRSGVSNYRDATLGDVHRDLRRAIKAAAMKYGLPTQILSERVTRREDEDHPSKIAWNFYTGLYTKAGGVPWAPTGLMPGTCYVGIGFFRPLGTAGHTLHTSLVQAFDEHGEGLVLRGPDFDWDPDRDGSRSPHLPAEQAAGLVELALSRYQREMKQTPRRVVVHKTSRYWPDERGGFEDVLRARVARYDLLALELQSSVRMITTTKYPPLRGTWFTIGELDFLYTTGFLAALGEYHSMHVPSPLRLADHVTSDTPRGTLLRETLVLTKLNWNSASLGGAIPITLRFAGLVGDIMREVPRDREPLPQFKFYM